MDSLHPSLSQALPLRGYDAEEVLQAPFRAAALGIATFYKRATENGRKAYSLGYSAALQDVLEYLQAGLDHGTDLPRPQRSEQRMALTIERVMDYIERRQEALRAESADSGEDEANVSSTGPTQTSRPTTGPSSIPLQPSTTPPSPIPTTQNLPPHAGGSTTRRTSPRRTSPLVMTRPPIERGSQPDRSSNFEYDFSPGPTFHLHPQPNLTRRQRDPKKGKSKDQRVVGSGSTTTTTTLELELEPIPEDRKRRYPIIEHHDVPSLVRNVDENEGRKDSDDSMIMDIVERPTKRVATRRPH